MKKFFSLKKILLIIVLIVTMISAISYVYNTKEVQNINSDNLQTTGIIGINKDTFKNKLDNKETFNIYIGKSSCPDCIEFYPKLQKIINNNKNTYIYYFDTESKGNEKDDIHNLLRGLNVLYIPMVLEIHSGTIKNYYYGSDDIKKIETLIKQAENPS